jgi:hypothetical protein
MKARHTCGLVAFGFLFVLVACLVFAALAGAMVLSGEVPLYAPRLIGVQPWTNYAFRPTTPLTFTFDQPMDAASFAGAFSLDPAVPGTFGWNQARTQVTFVPDAPGYEPGTAYTVRLVPGVKAGTLPRTTRQGTEWGFSLPPLVDTLSPHLGQEDLGPWTQLQVTFNYPLECDSTLRAFSITPDTVGQLECRDRTLAFNPTEPLAPGTAYAARVDQVYLEGDRSARPGVRWEFRTAPPLVVVDVLPAERGSVLGLWTPFRIAFNRPVAADSVLSRFSLAPEGGPALAGQVTWEEDGARFVFQPEEPLRPATRYRLVLRAGVQDELGFQLAEGLDRSFETAPMVGLPLPLPTATNVALDSAIRIPFTRPMDKASVEAGLDFTPTVEGQATWEGDTLVFKPRGSLAAQTDYRVTLSPAIRDASGAPLAEPGRWEFATEPFLLEARVPSTVTLMELQRPIEFVFALPMDRQSVLAALILSPTVTGTLVWTDDGRTVAFRPDPAWLSGIDYRVILSGSARSADGSQTLGKDQTWTFTTGVAQVGFGYGSNVQVMDAAGERAFQLIAQGADVADFCLYAITSTQFLTLYSSGFRGIGPQEPQVIDTTGLAVAAAWREALTPWGDEAYSPGQRGGAEAHLPSDVSPGLYVLSTVPAPSVPPQAGGTEGGQGQLLVVLSHHALVLKAALAGTASRSQAQVVAWDTELSTGAAVVSATVRLYDRDGAFLAEGQTGADGLATLDVPGDPGPLLALADKDGDLTVCGLGDEWSEAGWWWGQPTSRPLYTIYSYTDRPIYRPGQTVYFKDFVRADDDVSYTLPAPDLPVTVRLRDARDNVAASQVLTPTQFGTVYGQFQLADEPMLGTWELETEVEGTATRQPLKVEEYRKPEYEVTVQTPQSVYVQGEAISVTVDAAYYFGQPVGDAQVALAVYPTYPDEYSDEETTPFGSAIFLREGHTDEQGRWTATVSTDDVFPRDSTAQRAALALEATITDDSGQSVSSYQTVAVLRTSQGLAVLLQQHGHRPDEEILFAAQVRDRDGNPVAGTELTAQILGWDEREVASATAATDASGQAHFSVRLPEQSWYTLRVHGRDDSGRTMQAEEWLWVYDPAGRAPWYQGRWGKEATLSVSADRTTYAVGDEAQLVVYTPTPGPALLTFERGETRHAEPIMLISGTNLITVPIRADYAPNICVAVSQFGPLGKDRWPGQSWPEAELHQASAQLLVPMADRLLTVTLTADRETYAPGDEATFHVRVTDSQSQPVMAEVSLEVVDEAIYALAEDLSKDPFEVFYAPRLNLVRTFDSLRPSRWLSFERGQGGGGGEAGGAPRRNFLDTAYWAPIVVTDENGEAAITFRLPDNLTTWRALARAITADTRLGQTTTSVVVDKEIIVRPSLPRFLTQGDAITLTAVVHNFTSQAVSATVVLDLEGLTRTGGQGTGRQVVSVAANGAAAVAWPVVAEKPGEARVTVRATATYRGAHVAGRDAVELSLPVYPLAVAEVATFAGTLTPARPTDTITLSLPSDAIEDLSRLEINVAPSIAPGLLDGLEYLIDYPFG